MEAMTDYQFANMAAQARCPSCSAPLGSMVISEGHADDCPWVRQQYEAMRPMTSDEQAARYGNSIANAYRPITLPDQK
jgi:hypothetical protein